LGILCGFSNKISQLTEPFVEFFRYLPAPAFGALAVAILGINDAPKIAIIVIGTLFQQILIIANTTRMVDRELFQAVAMEKRMMGLMLVLIIAVATFNILSALVMVVTDKEGEVAILRTMGMSESGIVKIFMVLGASSGVIGALFGGLAGLALCFGLNPLLNALGLNLYMAAGGSGLPVIVEPAQVMTILLGAVLLSFSATLYPASRAARVKPAEALRYE
jgi:ABC-type lipoprotein release transport system permease subunit